MEQKINEKLFEEMEQEVQKAKKKLEGKARVVNSEPLRNGSWISKIVSRVRISELASENGIDCCPKCDYNLYFDDSRGFFICGNQRWNKKKCFSGNIVDFQMFIMEERK